MHSHGRARWSINSKICPVASHLLAPVLELQHTYRTRFLTRPRSRILAVRTGGRAGGYEGASMRDVARHIQI